MGSCSRRPSTMSWQLTGPTRPSGGACMAVREKVACRVLLRVRGQEVAQTPHIAVNVATLMCTLLTYEYYGWPEFVHPLGQRLILVRSPYYACACDVSWGQVPARPTHGLPRPRLLQRGGRGAAGGRITPHTGQSTPAAAAATTSSSSCCCSSAAAVAILNRGVGAGGDCDGPVPVAGARRLHPHGLQDPPAAR